MFICSGLKWKSDLKVDNKQIYVASVSLKWRFWYFADNLLKGYFWRQRKRKKKNLQSLHPILKPLRKRLF